MLNLLAERVSPEASREMERLLDNQRHSDESFAAHHTLGMDDLDRVMGERVSSPYGTGGGTRRHRLS